MSRPHLLGKCYISNFKKQVDLDSIFVADSALYTAENLLAIKNLKWITRVPLSIKAAQLYVRDIPESQFTDTEREGYKAVERESNRSFALTKSQEYVFGSIATSKRNKLLTII